MSKIKFVPKILEQEYLNTINTNGYNIAKF